MDVYARIDAAGEVTQWPVLEVHIVNRGLPLRFFEKVNPRPAPAHNPITHSAAQRKPVRDDAGRLVQAWEIMPRGVEAVRQDQIDRLADYRWRKETGGVSLPDGGAIDTTREAQAQISSAFSALQSGMIDSVEWKSGGAWVTLTLEQFAPMAAAVANHVQRCFAAEKVVSDLIELAETVEELAAIDIKAEFETAYSA